MARREATALALDGLRTAFVLGTRTCLRPPPGSGRELRALLVGDELSAIGQGSNFATTRSAFDCSYEDLLPKLRGWVEEHSGASLLRTYWYDGARDGIATADHRKIGDQPYVKVRLGRLDKKGQQKGVDGLIYRDLTTLARAGAIDRAYLFTGDEDMRESVVAAQDMGIQIVLITFTPTKHTGRSAELVREVDEVVVLEKDFWAPHFKRLVPEAAAEPPAEEVLAECAREFVEAWLDGATSDEIQKLKDRRDIPEEMHVQLIVAAEKRVGYLKPYPASKRTLRQQFWKAFNENTAESEDAPEADDSELPAEADLNANAAEGLSS